LEPLYAACLTRMEELLSWSASVPLTDNFHRSFDAWLQETGDPACVPLVFGYLSGPFHK